MLLPVAVGTQHLALIYFRQNFGPGAVGQIANRQFKFFCRRVQMVKVEYVTFKGLAAFFTAIVTFFADCIFQSSSQYSALCRPVRRSHHHRRRNPRRLRLADRWSVSTQVVPLDQ